MRVVLIINTGDASGVLSYVRLGNVGVLFRLETELAGPPPGWRGAFGNAGNGGGGDRGLPRWRNSTAALAVTRLLPVQWPKPEHGNALCRRRPGPCGHAELLCRPLELRGRCSELPRSTRLTGHGVRSAALK